MNMLERRKLVKEISLRIRKMRETLRSSPDSMAAHMGVARSSYNKYEYGEAFPGPIGLNALVNNFDISLDWLVANKGPMFYKGKAQMAEDENMAAVMGDVKDLLAHMERIPLLRYEVLTVFHRFKLEHKELLET